MKLKQFLFSCLFSLAVALFAAGQTVKEVELPATPAGKQAAAYVKAFNSGDAKALIEFMEKNDARPDRELPSAEIATTLFKGLGKLKITEIVLNKDYAIGLVLDTEKGKQILFDCEVQPEAPYKFTFFHFELGK